MNTIDLRVTGMTCDHCVRSVTSELTAVEGVDDVTVSLVSGGASTVQVHTSAPVSDEAIRAAIDEAGYAIEA